jgi:hypothetical protein
MKSHPKTAGMAFPAMQVMRLSSQKPSLMEKILFASKYFTTRYA